MFKSLIETLQAWRQKIKNWKDKRIEERANNPVPMQIAASFVVNENYAQTVFFNRYRKTTCTLGAGLNMNTAGEAG